MIAAGGGCCCSSNDEHAAPSVSAAVVVVCLFADVCRHVGLWLCVIVVCPPVRNPN